MRLAIGLLSVILIGAMCGLPLLAIAQDESLAPSDHEGHHDGGLGMEDFGFDDSDPGYYSDEDAGYDEGMQPEYDDGSGYDGSNQVEEDGASTPIIGPTGRVETYVPRRNALPLAPRLNVLPRNRILRNSGPIPSNGNPDQIPQGQIPGDRIKSPSVAVPRNVIPPQRPKNPVVGGRNVGPTGRTESVVPGAAAIAPAPVLPPRNDPFARSVVRPTVANVAEIKRQLQVQQMGMLDRINDLVGNNTAARQATQRLRDAIRGDRVTGRDVADVVRAIQTLPEAQRRAALQDLAQVVASQQITQWINQAVAALNGTAGQGGNVAAGGTGANPATGNAQGGPLGMANARGGAGQAGGGNRQARGGNVPMAVIPGLPRGLMVQLNNLLAALGGQGGGAGRGGAGRGGAGGGGAGGGGAGGGGAGNARGVAGAGNPGGRPRGARGRNGVAGGPMLVGMGRGGNRVAMGMGNPSRVAGLPIAPASAASARTPGPKPPDFGASILTNSEAEPISYTVNQSAFKLNPEDEQRLPSTTIWTVEFDRGNQTGNARYTLVGGTYEFRAGEKGWDLYKKTFRTKLDNSKGPAPFGFVMNGKVQSVPALQVLNLTSEYLPVIEFDDGTGQPKRRRLDGDHYQIAVRDDAFDVFPAENLLAAVSDSDSDNAPPPAPSSSLAEEEAPEDKKASAPTPAPAPAPTQDEDPASSEPSTEPKSTEPKSTEPKSGEVVASADPNEESMQLPAGFKMFDPVEALTKPEIGMALPEEFTLFRDTAKELALKDSSGKSRPSPVR